MKSTTLDNTLVALHLPWTLLPVYMRAFEVLPCMLMSLPCKDRSRPCTQTNGWEPLPNQLTVSTKAPLKRLNHATDLTCNTATFYVWKKKGDQVPVHTSHVVLKALRGDGKVDVNNLNTTQLHSLANTSTAVDASTTSALHKAEICKRMRLVSQAVVDADEKKVQETIAARTNAGTKHVRIRNRRKFHPTDQYDGLHIEELGLNMFRQEQLSSNISVEILLRLARATTTMVCVTQRLHAPCKRCVTHTSVPCCHHRPLRGHALNRGRRYAWCCVPPQTRIAR